MLEIAEVDHALALARDSAENGQLAEARRILIMLNDELAVGWLPKIQLAAHMIESGFFIDWGDLREEALLAVNVGIIEMLNRKDRVDAGRAKANITRVQDQIERKLLVRQEWKPGDSAAMVKRRIHRNHGVVYSLRSIQRDLKEIRPTEI